ncbi:MAG: M28 family metallopeptidase [Acidobacteria bacterium]|nr:M28 family metallopeptidase [Acidobacteriota bacterium]
MALKRRPLMHLLQQVVAVGILAAAGGPAGPEPGWEEKLRRIPQPERVREYLRFMSEEPHHAGSAGGRRVADYILKKYREWGLEAQIEEFETLLPTPVERSLELMEPEKFTAGLKEPAIAEDKDSSDEGQLPTFNAYSPDGDVAAQVVYVNFGMPEDYDRLEKMGVDVKGKIVPVRYGGGWRGIKPKMAHEHGAIGCLIYSDPREDGYYRGDTYPRGPFRPAQGVQRGSTLDMPLYSGDPLTPGWASEKGAQRLDRAEAKSLPKVPVLPISYADAQPILRNLAGPVAPEEWRGALPVTYHVGPGPAKVRLKVSFDWQIRPLYDVVARIRGAEFPDEWVIYGNHHDAWVNGADDPLSGNASLMETARALAELQKQGWKPKRTILLANWDAEEWGLIGSSEWGEKHAEELQEKAVVYVNSDSNARGILGASGSHTLERLLNDVARDIPDPESGLSLWEKMRADRLESAKTEEEKKKITDRADLRIGPLGAGSDYVVFVSHLGVASLNLGFSGKQGGGVYHSIYDTYAWYSRFADPDFVYGRALSLVTGTLLLRLADSPLLPFEFTNLADTLNLYVDELEKLKPQDVDLVSLRPALAEMKKAAEGFEAARKDAPALSPARLAEVNAVLYHTERAMLSPQGLPGRDWYRHRFYAPGLHTGYSAKTLPGVREAIEQKRWEEARQQLEGVKKAVADVTREINRAAELLRR